MPYTWTQPLAHGGLATEASLEEIAGVALYINDNHCPAYYSGDKTANNSNNSHNGYRGDYSDDSDWSDNSAYKGSNYGDYSQNTSNWSSDRYAYDAYHNYYGGDWDSDCPYCLPY